MPILFFYEQLIFFVNLSEIVQLSGFFAQIVWLFLNIYQQMKSYSAKFLLLTQTKELTFIEQALFMEKILSELRFRDLIYSVP